MEVLVLQQEYALRSVLEGVNGLRSDLSQSTQVIGVSAELAGGARRRPRAAAGDRAALPAAQRRGAVPARGHVHLREAAQHPCAGRPQRRARTRPGLPRRPRAARGPRPHPRLPRGQRRPARRRRPPGARDPDGRGLRPAPRDDGRPRARRRPPPRPRAAVRPPRRARIPIRGPAPRLPDVHPAQGTDVPPAARPRPRAAGRGGHADDGGVHHDRPDPRPVRPEGRAVLHRLDDHGAGRRARRRRCSRGRRGWSI